MKQTAVEWLVDELNNIKAWTKNDITLSKADILIEQAKKIEKEQHKKTWFESTSQFGNESEMIYRKDFEQYYNETFKKE